MLNFAKQEEEDFLSFLNQNKFHPLNYISISEIKLIGKTQDFKLYEFFNEDKEQFQTLKVMTKEKLFLKEKEILDIMKTRKVAVRMLNDFTF